MINQRDPHPQAPYEVLAKEQRENERVTSLRKKMRMNNLDLNESDLLGISPTRQTPQNQVAKAFLTEDDIYAGLTAEEAASVRSSEALFEDDPMRYSTHSSIMDSNGAPMQRKQPLIERMPERQVRNSTWSAKKLRAKLTNGEIVPVWKVTDSQSGIEMPTNFRIEEVAERVANILNETGNINDPRVVSTTTAYNKRVKLLKEMKQAKSNAAEGDIRAKKQLVTLKEEIAAIDYKLGI